MNTKIIICNVTKMRFFPFQWSALVYALFPINNYVLPKLGIDSLPESLVASIVFCLAFTVYLQLVLAVIWQICSALDINCLTIKKKKNE